MTAQPTEPAYNKTNISLFYGKTADIMNKTISTITAFFMTAAMAVAASAGTWKNYLAYSEITDVQQAGNTIFVLASNSLYSYNTADNSITTFDKTNGLSDCEIKMMAWCGAAKRLVAVYENGNIDMVERNGNTINIPDYYNYSTTSDKTVYGIDVIGDHAYLSTGFGITNINVAKAEITETYNFGFRVDYVYTDGTRIYAASSTDGVYSAPLSANLIDTSSWSYHSAYTPKDKTIDPGLLATAETLLPGGPKHNYFNFMTFRHGRLYTGGGYFCSGTASAARPGTVQVLDGDEWHVCQEQLDTITGYRYTDINCVAADPSDPDHIFAGGKSGLYEFNDWKLTRYFNKDNSPLMSAIDPPQPGGSELGNNYVLINGMTFDDKGSLWLFNCQTLANSLFEYTKEGEFIPHNKAEFMYNGVSIQAATNLMFDSRGMLWFVNSNYSDRSFFCYQPSTDTAKRFTPRYNQNGLEINIPNGIRCMAEDIDGNIWLGTSTGPLMLRASEITSDDPTFMQVIVPRNDGTNLGDYLLDNISITAMAIDGAGRKWFGTQGNGVYMVSRDNMEQVEHFTSADTPLLSDNIESIAINGTTGEVFFGTDKGLCSYMGDATAPGTEMTKDNVYAYPNPVRPDYTGPITIVGLTLDADVKITTANGTLVAEGRSQGGTFTWDGRDTGGRRVASGVYMVQTATSSGDKGTVCKIAIVR